MPFVVIGGQAVNIFGLSRLTADIDLVVPRRDKARWSALMEKLNYTVQQDDARFARYKPDTLAAWPIDLMFVDDQTFTRLEQESSEAFFGVARAQVASGRHLVTLKLHALKHYQEHRFAKDFSDVVGLLRSGKTGLSLVELRELCERYADLKLFEKLKDELPNGA